MPEESADRSSESEWLLNRETRKRIMNKRTLAAALALTFAGATLGALAGDTPPGAGKHANSPTGEGPNHQDSGAPYGSPGFSGEATALERLNPPTVDVQVDPVAAPMGSAIDAGWAHGNPPHGTADPGGPAGGPGWAAKTGQP
jgi:hypothetical protein